MRDSYVEIRKWSLNEAAIMHEFLDQIESQQAMADLARRTHG